MPRYLTFSNRHNARALAVGLQRLGHRLETLSDRHGWVRPASGEPQPGDVLFFTDERSLKTYVGEADKYVFLPRALDGRLLDDKLEWARAVTALGEVTVPFWDLPGAGPATAPELPVYLKARHSWVGARNLPRGYVCRTAADVTSALDQLASAGWERSQFFWQRLIAGPVSNCYSVCGFFDATDPERSVMVVSRKVLSDGRTVMSCGALVETVPDPAELLPRSARLLQAFSFTGPFELEYLRDSDSGLYYLLELNPRFWMQHGLFIDGYDNVLVSRYLGIETPAFPKGVPFRPLVWINTVDLLSRAFTMLSSDAHRRRVFLDVWRRQRAGQTRVVWSPGLFDAVRAVVSERARATGVWLRRWFAVSSP